MFINLKIPSKESIRFIKRKQIYEMKSDLTDSNITVLSTRENLDNTLNLIFEDKDEYKITKVINNFYLGRLDYIKFAYMESEFCEGNYCDCCGTPLNVFNRDDNISSLCKECNYKYNQLDFDKYDTRYENIHINLEYFE
jgi:hypothetical protein|nr:MAG TPA: Trm112p-like protein [Bacteriophage sp.]